jgi:hypothetical protein
LLDLLADLVADRVRARLGAADRRLARIGDVGITPRQLPALRREGVAFANVGKYWMVEAASLDDYIARQRADESAPAEPADAEPLRDVDPSIRAAFLRAAGGSR